MDLKFTKDIFIKELKKNIQTESLLSLFTEYLDNVEDHNVMRFLLTNHFSRNKNIILTEENKEILIACHSVFKYAQLLTDKASLYSKISNEKVSEDIMVSLTLYSAVYEVFKDKLKENAIDLIKLYEDACMSINSPREDIEENSLIVQLRSSYYCDFYLPCKILGLNHEFSEDQFILFCLFDLDCQELRDYYMKKLNINCSKETLLKNMEGNEKTLVKEVLKLINKN